MIMSDYYSNLQVNGMINYCVIKLHSTLISKPVALCCSYYGLPFLIYMSWHVGDVNFEKFKNQGRISISYFETFSFEDQETISKRSDELIKIKFSEPTVFDIESKTIKEIPLPEKIINRYNEAKIHYDEGYHDLKEGDIWWLRNEFEMNKYRTEMNKLNKYRTIDVILPC